MGLKQLLGRRVPPSAWILVVSGIVLVIAWAIYLIARKKQITATGCLCASFVLLSVFLPLQVNLSQSHSAYRVMTIAMEASVCLFIAAIVFWMIKHPNISRILLRYGIIMGVGTLVMSLSMTSVTELIYGRINNKTFLRLAVAVGVIILYRLSAFIIDRIRKKTIRTRSRRKNRIRIDGDRLTKGA